MNEFDKVIKNKLGDVPVPETKITNLNELKTIKLSENDKKTFSLLYTLRPSTSTGRENSQNIGNGEVAVYWLLKGNELNVKPNTHSDSKLADLFVDKVGIEVKAYDGPSGIHLGKISKKKNADLLEVLNISYTLSTISEYSNINSRVHYSTLSINPKELNKVFANVCTVRNNVVKWKDKLYGQNIQNAIFRLEHIYETTTNTMFPTDSTKLTSFFISELVKTKLKEKPGVGGYILNISTDGTIKSTHITESLINSDEFRENCTKHAKCKHGTIIINLDKLFGMAG